MKNYLTLSLLTAILAFAAIPAQAQKFVPAPATSAKKAASPEDIARQIQALPPEAQDEIFKQGEEAEKFCHDNIVYNDFYDCTCISTRMMEERFLQGPEVGFSSMILDSDTRMCVSSTKAADYVFGRCMESMKYATGTEASSAATCECASNRFVSDFTADAYADMRYIDGLYYNALTRCRE